jgi:hypothetical protein
MERVLWEVSNLSRTLRTASLAGGSGSSVAAPSGQAGGGDPARSEPTGWSTGPGTAAGGLGASHADPPPRREARGWSRGTGAGSGGPAAPYRPAPPAAPWDDQAQTSWLGDIDARASDPASAGAFDPPAAAPFDQEQADSFDRAAASGFEPPAPTPRELPAEPVAPRAPAGPPPNAVSVEARDDRIVASSSYPPEAWLEPRGPAVAHLWLNPAVALNENALRRLSTFFEWRGERAGATYDTDTPAVLRWDEGQRVGTVTQRGTARPR